MILKPVVTDDGAAGVYDGLSGALLGDAGVVVGSGTMPVATEVGIGVDFEALVPFGVKRDPLRPCFFQVFR